MIDWWNSVTGRQPEDEDPVTRALRLLGAAPGPEQAPARPAAGSGQPAFAPEDYSSNVIAPPMPQETAAAPFQDTYTPEQSPVEAPTAPSTPNPPQDQVTRYVPSYAPQAAQVTAPEPPAERPYWAPTETESAAVGAGIDATLAAEPAGPAWLPAPVRTAAGAGLGALQTVQAVDQAVRARIDPRVWVFARDGIARTELPPGMWERYNELAGAADPATGRGKTELTPDERAEYDAIRAEVEARYQQIKDDPDALTRYANASPGYGVASAATDLALAPAAGSVAAGIARPAAAALGAGPRAVRAAGYAADVAGESLVDPTSLPLQPAADALLTGMRAVPGALRRAMADNAERVAAADARMLSEGSTQLPAMFGAVPDPRSGVPTVEVIQEQLDAARAAVDQARATGDLATAHAATEHVWALTDQLADALNARRALEPRIASDVGRQANPLTLTEESAADFNRALRPQDLVSPEDAANLGGPASVPRPSISLNAGAGAVPTAPGSGPLATVNRALSEGIAGGVGGAVIEQGRNPDEDPRTAAARGFAAGAVGFPVATRLARGAAHLAGAAPSPSGGAMATLGTSGAGGHGGPPGLLASIGAAYGRRKALNAASMQAKGITPASGLRLAAEVPGLLSHSALLSPGTALIAASGNLIDAARAGPRELVRTAARAAETGNASAWREAGEAAQGAMSALYGHGWVGEQLVDLLRGRGQYASLPDAPRLSERTADPALRAIFGALEAPGRVFSGAADALFGTIARKGAEYRHAAQVATNAGLDGAAWEQRMDQVLAEIEQARRSGQPAVGDAADAMAAGEQAAQRAGYTEPLGRAGEAAKKVARLGLPGPLGTFVAPYFNSPWNSFIRLGENLPTGVLMGRGSPAGVPGGGRHRVDRVFDAVTGTALVAGLLTYGTSGRVTGSGPEDPDERKALMATGWRPYSYLVDGLYLPNRSAGQYETLLNAVGEYADWIKYRKPEADQRHVGEDAIRRIGRVATQAPFAAGFSTLMDYIDYGAAGLATDIATRLTPFASTARQLGQMQDPYERAPERGKGVGFWDEVRQRWQQSTGQRAGLPIAQDVLGRERPNPRMGAGTLLPAYGVQRDEPIIGAYLDAGVDLATLPTELSGLNLKAGVEPPELTPEERRRWNAYRGEALIAKADGPSRDPAFQSLPLERRKKLLEQWRGDANDAAHRRLRAEIGPEEITRRIEERARRKAS